MSAPRVVPIALLLALSLGATACADDPAPVAKVVAGSGCSAAAATGTTVAFTAGDDARLVGVEWGSGRTGVVFAHQDQSSLCSWVPYATDLAGRGYRVLAFDFAAEGDSGPAVGVTELDREVAEAVGHLRAGQVTDVVLIGASKGGAAVLTAATALDPPPKAVVALSAPVQFSSMDARTAAGTLRSPVLYVAARDDGSFPLNARSLYGVTPAATRKGLVLVDGREHGAFLLGGTDAGRVRTAVDDFLKAQAPPAG